MNTTGHPITLPPPLYSLCTGAEGDPDTAYENVTHESLPPEPNFKPQTSPELAYAQGGRGCSSTARKNKCIQSMNVKSMKQQSIMNLSKSMMSSLNRMQEQLSEQQKQLDSLCRQLEIAELYEEMCERMRLDQTEQNKTPF
jgi:hypothetical protein